MDKLNQALSALASGTYNSGPAAAQKKTAVKKRKPRRNSDKQTYSIRASKDLFQKLKYISEVNHTHFVDVIDAAFTLAIQKYEKQYGVITLPDEKNSEEPFSF